MVGTTSSESGEAICNIQLAKMLTIKQLCTLVHCDTDSSRETSLHLRQILQDDWMICMLRLS